MAQQNTTSTLDGLFKVVYGDGPVNAIPEVSILQKKITYKSADRIGKSYNFPVILSSEAGVTYIAAGGGSTTLVDSVAATLKEAVVDANQIIVRGQMDYEAAAKAVEGGKASFKNASELLVENLMETASTRLEIAMLYGQSPTGLGTGDSSVNTNTTTTVVLFLASGWAPGIWSGKEGASLSFWKVSDDTAAATVNTFVISAIDYSTRKLTLTGTATTGIGELDTALAAGDCYATFKGAKTGTSTWVEPVGIDKIIVNTGSLFGISATTYSLWGGSTFSFGSAAATVAKVLNMVGMAVSKGGLMEEADVLLSPKTYMNLAGTMTDLRRQNGGQSETVGIGGFESIVLMGPNGKLNLVVHPMVKEGECFAGPFAKRFKRIGSSEFSFETPGRKGEIFLHIPDKNAYELRIYGAQAIVCTTPAKFVKGNLIVNT
jgi:hypothetical protein